MAEKRMFIVDAEVARRVDESRGEMSRSEFINFLIDSNLKEDEEYKEDTSKKHYITREEFYQSQQGIKELLRSFLEFFLSYGLEVGKQPDKNFNELSEKLQALSSSKSKNP